MSTPITFTTFFFELGRSEPYYKWIETLLEQDFNLVFYTTQKIHDKLTYNPRKNLKFVIEERKVDSVLLTKFKKSWSSYTTTNKEKDTYEFAYLTHTKFDYVQRTISENPFSTEHFGWIDAGIHKVANNIGSIPLIKISEQVSIVILRRDPKFWKSVEDVSYPKQLVAGGLFHGNAENMKTFCQLMFDQRDKNLGLEQEHMAVLYVKYPELFVGRDGYYQTIIEVNT